MEKTVAHNDTARPYRHSFDDMRGFLEDARVRLDRVVALFVYVDGWCGRDCSGSFDVHDDPRAAFSEEAAMIAGYLREVEKELERLDAEQHVEKSRTPDLREHEEEHGPTSEAAEEE